MTLTYDDLESNKFFNELQTSYASKFREAQKKLWLICIPSEKSLKGLPITKEFVDMHILKPSPFFKGQFLTTDNDNSMTLEVENGFINTPSGIVKILMEETAYNDDYKPYKILIIERPLSCSLEKKDEFCNSVSTDKGFPLSLNECLNFFSLFPECSEIVEILDKKIHAFNSSYIVLPQYLRDAAFKLRSISVWASEEIFKALRLASVDKYSCAEMSAIVENYIFCHVHDKIFPVIKKYCFEDDKMLNQKLLSLYEANITPDQLGVRESFCCQTPSAVVELASLNSRCSPADKLACLMTTLELLNQDIEQFLSETCDPVSNNKDALCLTSDDLIPLLVGVIVQARPQYLVSNLYYIQNFCWEMSSMDKFSFSLVTFQAAKEFLKSNEFEFLKPSTRRVKKELTLEELMEVTVEIQNNTKSCTEIKSTHGQSSIDFQLENVTKMIEASTQDLRERTSVKDSKSIPNKNLLKAEKEENVGSFLSNLRQNSLGLTFGKQT